MSESIQPFIAESYSICQGLGSTPSSWGAWASSGNHASPLFYIRRPKWIKDDACWKKIVKSIKITLLAGTEIK
jgi:hypothetical protein